MPSLLRSAVFGSSPVRSKLITQRRFFCGGSLLLSGRVIHLDGDSLKLEPHSSGHHVPLSYCAYAERARPRWRSHQRRARRCRLQRRRLATMRTGANYSLWMVGRQARHGGPTCVENIPERGWGPSGVGPLRSRRCQNGTTRNTLSSGRLTTRFLFAKFFPKKFRQKIGAGPPTEISGMVCVRVRSCSTPPPLSCR